MNPKVQKVLNEAGWSKTRKNGAALAEWRKEIESSNEFKIFDAAEKILISYGGLKGGKSDSGLECATSVFNFTPTVATGEYERFSEFEEAIDSKLYPIGELDGGCFFLAVDEGGKIYLIMDDCWLLGENIIEALESIVLGKEAKYIA